MLFDRRDGLMYDVPAYQRTRMGGMRKLFLWGCLALVISAVTLSGCASLQGADDVEGDASLVSDRALASEVNDRLRMDRQTTKYTIGVSVEDGIVTLTGPVREAAARMQAIGIVRGTPGVKGVVDQMIQF
jgi:outer membrane murein-binding lipoprotein Lpp